MRQRNFLLPIFDGGAAKQQRAGGGGGGGGGRYYNPSSNVSNSAPPTATRTAVLLTDDADVAATGRLNNNNNNNGTQQSMTSAYSVETLSSLETAPTSVCTINTVQGHPGDLEFFEDLITEPVLVLGFDISHLSAASQFTVCALALFCFSLLYGYLQELLSVELCSRQLGLFLAMVQFTAYTVLAYFMRSFVYNKQQRHRKAALDTGKKQMLDAKHVPLALYLGLALLRAVDLAMVRTVQNDYERGGAVCLFDFVWRF
jgi:hypothetical protein